MTSEATKAVPGSPTFRFHDLLEHLATSSVEEWPARLSSVSLLDVSHLLTFSPTKYTRNLVAANDNVELFVMGWLPGQASAIHDHGKSHGAALVLAGEAEEDTFMAVRDGVQRKETAIRKRGQSTLERPTDIHRMRNASTQLLVTLHAYAPRLADYRTYEAP